MNAKQPVDFAAGDDLSDMLGSAAQPQPKPLPTDTAYARIREENPVFEERCRKCDGYGQFRSYTGRPLGRCFACKGKGKQVYKTSPQERAKSAAKYHERKEQQVTSNWDSFVEAQPDVAAWMLANPTFEFAVSLKAGVEKHGQLTERQLEAAQRCVAKSVARREQRQAEAQSRATDIDCTKIAEAFARAKVNGLKKPKMFVTGLKFSLAPDHGKNAGSIYVTGAKGTAADGERQYLGKITGNVYAPTSEATPELIAKVVLVAADPGAAAKAYGLQVGECSCCGRELTDAESIKAGIGPVCATKYGF
jgi:hypothetical protein